VGDAMPGSDRPGPDQLHPATCASCGSTAGTAGAELRAALDHRQSVLTEMVAVQRALARRGPLQQKLDLVTQAVSRVLDVKLVGIRLVDRTNPEELLVVSGTGLDPTLPIRSPVAGSGVGGAAFRSNQTVCVDDYGEHPAAMGHYLRAGVRVVMGVPVQKFGRAVGSIVAASTTPGRRFDETDRETLRAFADQASIALTEQHLFEEMQQGYTDPLTGLANRVQLLIGLSAALNLVADDGSTAAVLFIDLDGFKIVNDTLGHAIGDELLVKVAQRLRRAAPGTATVGRFGGDEFLILLPACAAVSEASAVAQHLLDALTASFDVSGHEVTIAASIGIAWAGGTGGTEPGSAASSLDLLRHADTAMYRAKAAGRGRYCVFEQEMYDDLVRALARERDLREAVESEAMTAHFQPIVDLGTGTVTGAEALVRWDHGGRLVPPLEFVGIAEETGLIVPLGRQMLRHACNALAQWRHAGLNTLSMSVNLSVRELESPSLVDDLQAELDRTGVDPSSLVIELTESALMRDVTSMSVRLTTLRSLGVRIAIDDFGTGYSSLARLRWLPIDILKIDRSFVDELDSDRLSRAMAATVLQLADALGLEVVAEGVERDAQRTVLLDLGCRVGQGYLFGRPLPLPEMTALLLRGQAGPGAGSVAPAISMSMKPFVTPGAAR
jgi:diguanylate cyclase (GGDEF)-like protein